MPYEREHNELGYMSLDPRIQQLAYVAIAAMTPKKRLQYWDGLACAIDQARLEHDLQREMDLRILRIICEEVMQEKGEKL